MIFIQHFCRTHVTSLHFFHFLDEPHCISISSCHSRLFIDGPNIGWRLSTSDALSSLSASSGLDFIPDRSTTSLSPMILSLMLLIASTVFLIDTEKITKSESLRYDSTRSSSVDLQIVCIFFTTFLRCCCINFQKFPSHHMIDAVCMVFSIFLFQYIKLFLY